jgi:hypothetical protein
MKQKKKHSVLEQVKAARKQSRDEEIQTHGKSINYRKVMASKKQYNRKKNKADDEVLPYFFISPLHLERGLRGEVTKYLHVFPLEQTTYYLL